MNAQVLHWMQDSWRWVWPELRGRSVVRKVWRVYVACRMTCVSAAVFASDVRTLRWLSGEREVPGGVTGGGAGCAAGVGAGDAGGGGVVPAAGGGGAGGDAGGVGGAAAFAAAGGGDGGEPGVYGGPAGGVHERVP